MLGLLGAALLALMLSLSPCVLSASDLPVSDPSPPHPFLATLPWDIDQPPEERMNEWLLNLDKEGGLQRRDWEIPTAGMPPAVAVYDWVLRNDSSWPIIANAGVRRMQTWFDDSNLYDGLSWWQHPVVMMSYMDLDRSLNQSTNANEQIVTKILSNNDRGVQYMIDAYVDDQAWWGLAAATAYELYGNSTWLDAAKSIQQNDASYWTDDCGGGLLWLTYEPSYGKNTVTNTLQIALSARLYKITGEETYLEDAQKTLNWWTSWAYEASNGTVYDTLTAYSCVQTDLQLFTYNSAIILGGLIDLYTTTGNSSFLSTAQNIAYAAIRDFSTSEGIMQEGCEHDGPPNNSGDVSAANGGPENNLPAGCQSDTIMFKSILAQNLGYLYRVAPDERLYKYLTYNFLMSVFFNMDDTFLFGEWWDGPYNATLANQLTQGNVLGLLSAAIVVNNAFEDNKRRNASGESPLSFTQTFKVPLPTAGENPATSTNLKRAKRNAVVLE